MMFREIIYYNVGMPQIVKNIAHIEVIDDDIDWVKIVIAKGIDDQQNLYNITMLYKSPLHNKWVEVTAWEYRVTQRLAEANFVETLVEKGRIAFSDPEAIYMIGMKLEDEKNVFDKRAIYRDSLISIFNKVLKPRFINTDKELELQLKFAEERAKRIEEESKQLAIETDLRKIRELLGHLTPQKEQELRMSLAQKYNATQLQKSMPSNVPTTLADVKPTGDVSGIVIDIGEAT